MDLIFTGNMLNYGYLSVEGLRGKGLSLVRGGAGRVHLKFISTLDRGRDRGSQVVVALFAVHLTVQVLPQEPFHCHRTLHPTAVVRFDQPRRRAVLRLRVLQPTREDWDDL